MNQSLSKVTFLRYKIADSGTTAAFDAISEWTVSNNVGQLIVQVILKSEVH